MAMISEITQKYNREGPYTYIYNGKEYRDKAQADAARNADIQANPDAATSSYDFMGREAQRAAELQALASEQAGQQFTQAAEPWQQQGLSALTAQNQLMGLGGESPEEQLKALINSPGYQFRLDQGNQAINRSAAAKGMLNSGNVLAELAKYGQGMASTEYGNRLSQLGNLSTQGMGQANMIGENQGNSTIGAANARASGITGRLSALSTDPNFSNTTNSWGNVLKQGNWANPADIAGGATWKPGAKWQNKQWV